MGLIGGKAPGHGVSCSGLPEIRIRRLEKGGTERFAVMSRCVCGALSKPLKECRTMDQAEQYVRELGDGGLVRWIEDGRDGKPLHQHVESRDGSRKSIAMLRPISRAMIDEMLKEREEA